MKKLLLISFSIIIFFAPGCEEEGEDSNTIFSISDNGYIWNDYYAVHLHDAANPTDPSIAFALMEQGGSVVFTKDSLSVDENDVESLIVTILQFDESGMEFDVTSNWFVKKGAVWNMEGPYDELDYESDTVRVTIKAPTGNYITNYFNDIGNYYEYGNYEAESEISNVHYVDAVDEEGKITISSVVKMDDENWYLGVLEDQDWVRGIEFTIDEWQTGMINTLTVPITDLSDKDFFYIQSKRYSDTYSSYDDLVNWLTAFKYTYEPDTLGGSITVNTTDGIPGADKQRVLCRWKQSEPNYISSYTDNLDYQAGETMAPKDMGISFNYSSATGTMINIVADSDIDQVRFGFSLIDDEGYYYYWNNYFDPSEGSRFDLPNIGDLNLTIDYVSTVFVEDYDNFDSSADIVKALFEDNNYYSSWTNRHYNYIGGLTDGLLGRQQVNNGPEEFDNQELDMFGTPISPPRFK
jgi:hypothetical protein